MAIDTGIIDGREVAQAVRGEVRQRLEALRARTGVTAGLATILVGEDPASKVYVGNKHKACHDVGMESFDVTLPAGATQTEVEAKVAETAADERIHGMILQLPLPKGLDGVAAMNTIPAAKDADGLTLASQGRLATNLPGPRPATPWGVIRLLEHYDVPMSGRHAVIVGRSNIVGKPLVHLFLEQNCTVTICHSRTADLEAECRRGDIVIGAVGVPKLIGRAHVSEGAVVVDVGINRTDAGLVGDCDFEGLQGIARLITPVPGGVGPMTIAMLLTNTVALAEAALAG
jgi:methylenetetrahydrofolate dehydrogenase (NADP+)/methenyltetrahydrofolate cyclohydrolase